MGLSKKLHTTKLFFSFCYRAYENKNRGDLLTAIASGRMGGGGGLDRRVANKNMFLSICLSFSRARSSNHLDR